jgi:hypothetical protein
VHQLLPFKLAGEYTKRTITIVNKCVSVSDHLFLVLDKVSPQCDITTTARDDDESFKLRKKDIIGKCGLCEKYYFQECLLIMFNRLYIPLDTSICPITSKHPFIPKNSIQKINQ